MNSVEPIRDKDRIAEIKANLKALSDPRDFLIFTLGVNSALRSSDLLKLRVRDVVDGEGKPLHHIYLRQTKTGGEVKPLINESVREALAHYFKNQGRDLGLDDLLFTSHRTNRPLDNVTLWNLVNLWCKKVGLDGNDRYGSHSLRKTWGFHAWKMEMPLELISTKLGHKDVQTAMRYIGISQTLIWEFEEKLNL